MRDRFGRSVVALMLLLGLALATASALRAQGGAQSYEQALEKFAADSYNDTDAAIAGVAASGNPLAAQVITALQDGRLLFNSDDKKIYIRDAKGGHRRCRHRPADRGHRTCQPQAGARQQPHPARHRGGARRPDAALARPGQALRGRERRLQVEGRQSAGDRSTRRSPRRPTRASSVRCWRRGRPSSSASPSAKEADRIDAIDVLRDRGDLDSRGLLSAVPADQPPAVAQALAEAIKAIDNRLAAWSVAQNLWYGLSLGSVLLLAAIGLAITFGVMGVINMAHGEMVMLGAYTTFVVQELIRTQAPWLFDYSLAIAIPLAFLVAALVGMAIERGVIRFLYGRPLETLLATWGISLDPAAGGAHRLRADQPRGRRAALHVGRVRARRAHHHLEPAVDHRLRRPGPGGAAGRAALHHARPADARRHPEPPHGELDGASTPAASTR